MSFDRPRQYSSPIEYLNRSEKFEIELHLFSTEINRIIWQTIATFNEHDIIGKLKDGTEKKLFRIMLLASNEDTVSFKICEIYDEKITYSQAVDFTKYLLLALSK